MKMMIVGAAEKGKTTLLHQLLQEKHTSAPKANIATMGVSVKHWSYQQRQISGSMVTYHVNCWDFAGQEEFYSTHQCFLTQRSLYVVCLLLLFSQACMTKTEDFNEFRALQLLLNCHNNYYIFFPLQLVYNLSLGEIELQMLLPWLLNIQARAPSSPIIVVGTHADQLTTEEFEKQRSLIKEKIKQMLRRPGFPIDVSFAEVSCFDEKQVFELRKKIKRLIDKYVIDKCTKNKNKINIGIFACVD